MDFIQGGLYLFYNLTLLAGTAYLVQENGWSPWWFVLTISLLLVPK